MSNKQQSKNVDQKEAIVEAVADEPAVRVIPSVAPAKSGARGEATVALAPNKKTVSPVNAIESRLLAYCAAMAPNKVQDKSSLTRNQRELVSIVETLMGFAGSSFPQAMTAVIKIAKDHREGAFHDRYIARGLQGLFNDGFISVDRRSMLENLLSLIVVAADSKDPRAVQDKVDLSQLITSMPTEDVSNKITSYFNK